MVPLFLTLALDGGELSALCSGCFIPEETALGMTIINVYFIYTLKLYLISQCVYVSTTGYSTILYTCLQILQKLLSCLEERTVQVMVCKMKRNLLPRKSSTKGEKIHLTRSKFGKPPTNSRS
jgi:hypothetical protein